MPDIFDQVASPATSSASGDIFDQASSETPTDAVPAGATGPLPGVQAHPAVDMHEAPGLFGVDVPAGSRERVTKRLGESYEQNPGPVGTVLKTAGQAAGNIASGIRNVYTPTDAELRQNEFPSLPMNPQERSTANRQASKGLAQVIAGGSTGVVAATAPELMELGIAADAGDVAAKAAIIKMLGAAEVGNAASAGAGAAADKLNLSPETKELVQTAAFFLPSMGGMLGFKGGVGVDAEGNPGIAGQTPGGGVTAGVRGTPESFQGGVRVGNTRFEVNIPRGGNGNGNGAPALPSAGDVAHAEQTATAASTIAQADAVSAAAHAVVNGQPPTPPQPEGPQPPPSMQNGHLTPKTIDSMAQMIAAAPEEARAKLTMSAHQKLSQWIAEQKRFVGPDGKVYTADTPEKADQIAEKIINDAAAAHSKNAEAQAKDQQKAAEQQQKAQEAQKKEAEKAATQKNENGLTPDEQAAARVKTLMEANPDHKNPAQMVQRVLRVPAERAQQLVDEYHNGQMKTVGSAQEPVVEESRATVDAQIGALQNGDINVVMVPDGSSYRPQPPQGMKAIDIKGDVPGAGRYIYNPQKIRAATIKEAAKAGTHGDLLGHIQTKEELEKSEQPQVVVQARTPEGTVIQDSAVENTPDNVQAQAEQLQERHPDATIEVKSPEDVISERQEAAGSGGDIFDQAGQEEPHAVSEQSATEMGAHAGGDEGSGRPAESGGVGSIEQGHEAPREEGSGEKGSANESRLGEPEVKAHVDDVEDAIREGIGNATLIPWIDRDNRKSIDAVKAEFERRGWELNDKAGQLEKDGWHVWFRSQGDLSSPIAQWGRNKVGKNYEGEGERRENSEQMAQGEASTAPAPSEKKTKYDFGNTHAVVPVSSEAHKAIEAVRAKVKDSDLEGKGKDVGENHVTVRYGIRGDDISGIREYLKKQAPFTVKLGPVDSFPANKNTDGAAVLKAQVESADLHRMNDEIQQAGDFKPSDFPDYKPHVTIAYVKPEAVKKYVGSKLTEGKSFQVNAIDISDRNGDIETVQLEGERRNKVEPAPVKHPVTYLTGKDSPKIREAAQRRGDIGLLVTPLKPDYLSFAKDYPVIGVDNGVFSKVKPFDDKKFRTLVEKVAADPEVAKKVRFVVAPDVVGDAEKTLGQFDEWADYIHDQGLPVALAAQDGIEFMPDKIPWDKVDVLFLGGSTEWKTGLHTQKFTPGKGLERNPHYKEGAPGAWANLFRTAEANGVPVHMGRVNSATRLDLAEYGLGATTVDGTFLAYGPDKNQPQLEDWLNKQNRRDDLAHAPTAKGEKVSFKDRSGTERVGTIAHSGDRITRIKSDGKEYTVPTKDLRMPPVEDARAQKRTPVGPFRVEPDEANGGFVVKDANDIGWVATTSEERAQKAAGEMEAKYSTSNDVAKTELKKAPKFGLSVIKNDFTGKYRYVGTVPAELDGKTFDTEEEAVKAANDAGWVANVPKRPESAVQSPQEQPAPTHTPTTTADEGSAGQGVEARGEGGPPAEEEEIGDVARNGSTGERRETPDSGSADQSALAEVPPREVQEPRESGNAPEGSEDRSPAVSRPDESVSGEGTLSRPSEGSDSALDNSPGQRVVKEANKNLAKVPKKNTNWFSHGDNWTAPTGNMGRMDANIRALQLLREVEKNPRKLTDDEKYELSQFVGWGALPRVFDPYGAYGSERNRYEQAYRTLKDLLSDEEFAAARKSTLNAHYTSPELVRSMWDIAKRFGFKGGNVLEPSMGSGNFFGMMPKAIRGNVSAMGNELDPITAGIAKLLYPDATIFNKDFVQLIIPDNSIDLAISNVPFGGKIYDPKYPKLNAEIHDYFFVKSLDKVRPGGVLMFITSTGTMDKSSDKVREALGSKADFLGAIRLPSGAFSKNAGTEVTTDLIMLQKRAPGQDPKHAADWMKSVAVEVPYDIDKPSGPMHKTNLNEYFDKNPEMMLGRPGVSTMYSRSGFALYPHKEGEILEYLQEAIDKLPKGVMLPEKATSSNQAETISQFAKQNQLEGQYVLDDKGNLRQVQGGKLVKPPVLEAKDGSVSVTKMQRLKAMVGVREEMNNLLSLMTTEPDDEAGNSKVAKQREKLKKLYEGFTKKYGYLSASPNNVMEDDPHYPRLLALETYDKATKLGTPADILQKRTVFPRTPLTTLSDNPKDALFQILAERGYPDVEMMAKMQGKDAAEVAKALTDQGLIFRDPHTGDYEMKEKYLSGYVRDKLDSARAAVAQGLKEYQPNVEALEKVQPTDVPIDQIDVKLGATWIPTDALADFAEETFAQPWKPKITNTLGTWSVSNLQPTAEVVATYGTSEVTAGELMALALNQKEVTIKRKDSDGKEYVDQAATQIARQKQQAIRDQLNTWAQKSEKWAKRLEKGYNYAYNNIVLPEYDGSHLTFPGMTMAIRLNPHQVNVVWRLLSEGRGLLAHAVGAGKTFASIAFVMEARRTGQFRKPVINVPNHLVEQWRKEWIQLYPGANILVPTENDFDAKNRQRLMARIATSDFDAVIMARSQFDRFDISPERTAKTIQAQMDELEETIRAMEANREDKRTVKQMEKAREALRTRLKKLADTKTDKVINFDDTGIDLVVTDEAHDYKNLAFYTKMSRIAGLSQGDAKRAISMKAKMDYLLERNNYKGVVFATGTPVQNTMAEQYNMTKYVAPDVLEKAGIKFFDDWAANFGSVRTVTEVGADGRSYKQRQKFSRFTNVPELMRMFRSFTDIKTAADLNLPVPKLDGGKPAANLVPASPELDEYVRDLVKRAETVKNKNPKEDNMLKITGDGRKAATDLRLVSPEYKDDPDSKINQVVEDVYHEWKEGKEQKLTQMVFLDNYQAFETTRNALDEETGKNVRLDLYKDMKKKWMALGIPEKEIAIIGDYDTKEKKSKLFAAMNNGDVRILMGSTAKMGAGTNAQRLLKVLHHVDLPWRPGDLEQRNGRIIRQGNLNKEVKVKNWLTRGSFDTYMLQALESKAKFIEQLMNGRFEGRTMEDINSDMSMNLQEMKIATSGNPDVKLKFDLEAESIGLYNLKRGWDREQSDNIFRVGQLRKQASEEEAYAKRISAVEKKYMQARGENGDKFTMRLDGKDFANREEAGKYVAEMEVPTSNFYMDVNGVGYSIQTFDDSNEPIMKVTSEYGKQWDAPQRSMESLLRSITGRQAELKGAEAEALKDVAYYREKADKLQAGTGGKFPQQARLEEIEKQLKEVDQRLGIGGPIKDEASAVVEEDEPDEEEEGEDEEGETKPAKRESKGVTMRGSLFGVDLLAQYVADQGKTFVEKDILPRMKKLGPTAGAAAKQAASILYPRLGANEDALDSLFRAKGERERYRVELEQLMGGLDKFFDKMPRDAQIAFMDRAKMGIDQLGATPEETKKLREIRDLMENLSYETTQRMLNYKPNMALREHYFGMVWKEIPDPNGKHAAANAARAAGNFTGKSKRPFEGSKGFLKRSTLENITEGINMGGVPVTYNPWKMFALVESQKMQYITAQDHWARLKKYGLRKFVKHGERPPEGWKALDDRLAKTFFPAQSGEGMVHAGDWYLEESAARLLNNYLSRDLIRESAIGNALMVAKNIATGIELSLSPFHLIFETLEAVGSQLGMAGQRFWNLGVREGSGANMLHGLGDAAKSVAAPVLMARAGGSVIRSIRNPQDFANTKRGAQFLKQFPNAPAVIDRLFEGGLTWGQPEEYRTSPMTSFREAWRDDNHVGAILRALPALNDFVMKPLFEVYIPRLKWGLAMQQYGLQMEENAEKLANGQTTPATIARQVVDTVENRFGEMNFSNVMWSNTFKSVLQFLFRSVTWKLGNWRGVATAAFPEMKQSFEDPFRAMVDAAKGKGGQHTAKDYIPKIGPNLAWLLGMGAMTVTLGSILGKYFTGKWPWEYTEEDKGKGYSAPGSVLLEAIHPRTGRTNPYTHKPERFSLPTGMRDYEHAFHDPKSYAKSSMSGTAARFIDILENRDFYGDYVYDPNGSLLQKAGESLKYAAPQPIGYSSLTSKYGSQETSSKVMRSLGFSASSGAGLDLTPAEQKLVDIRRANHDPMTPRDKSAKESGFNHTIPSVANVRRHLRNGDVDYAAGMFGDLTYGQMKDVVEAANPQEKRVLVPIMQRKRVSLLRRGAIVSTR